MYWQRFTVYLVFIKIKLANLLVLCSNILIVTCLRCFFNCVLNLEHAETRHDPESKLKNEIETHFAVQDPTQNKKL